MKWPLLPWSLKRSVQRTWTSSAFSTNESPGSALVAGPQSRARSGSEKKLQILGHELSATYDDSTNTHLSEKNPSLAMPINSTDFTHCSTRYHPRKPPPSDPPIRESQASRPLWTESLQRYGSRILMWRSKISQRQLYYCTARSSSLPFHRIAPQKWPLHNLACVCRIILKVENTAVCIIPN